MTYMVPGNSASRTAFKYPPHFASISTTSGSHARITSTSRDAQIDSPTRAMAMGARLASTRRNNVFATRVLNQLSSSTYGWYAATPGSSDCDWRQPTKHTSSKQGSPVRAVSCCRSASLPDRIAPRSVVKIQARNVSPQIGVMNVKNGRLQAGLEESGSGSREGSETRGRPASNSSASIKNFTPQLISSCVK